MTDSDVITITLKRDKAEYMSKSFLKDLEWLGITAGIDLGECYLDFIEEVRKQRAIKNTPELQHPTDIKTFRLQLKKYVKEIGISDRGITLWDCRGKIAFRFRSSYGATDTSFVTKNFYWKDQQDINKVWEKFKKILKNYPYDLCKLAQITKDSFAMTAKHSTVEEDYD